MTGSTKGLREQRGLTQKDFADKFGIPLRTVQNWECRCCCPGYVLALFFRYYSEKDEVARLNRELRGKCPGNLPGSSPVIRF